MRVVFNSATPLFFFFAFVWTFGLMCYVHIRVLILVVSSYLCVCSNLWAKIKALNFWSFTEKSVELITFESNLRIIMTFCVNVMALMDAPPLHIAIPCHQKYQYGGPENNWNRSGNSDTVWRVLKLCVIIQLQNNVEITFSSSWSRSYAN